MNCIFEDTGVVNHRGLREWRCVRSFCGIVATVPTWQVKENIVSPNCQGWPLVNETEEWTKILTHALGWGEVQIAAWRLRGSPIDELPPRPALPGAILTDAEVAELFPNEDPTLIGNRIKALTEAVGIPMCGGCEKRREWLNAAHAYLRGRGVG